MLQLLLQRIVQPDDPAEETAKHTRQMSTALTALTNKVDRSNALLDRIHRDQGGDVVSLRNASTQTATA